MARQVLPWVGAAVGGYFGGPQGAQIGFAIGSLVGNAVDPQVIKGPALGEGQQNVASEGGYRPIVLGKGAVGVCMIHEGPEIRRTIRNRQSKGGGPVTEEQRMYRTMAYGLGESADPTNGVTLLRLWIDNKLRYDVTPASQIVAESAEFANEFTFYPGDLDQQPDPDIEAFLGAGNVPSYPGSPYIVFPHWDVTDSRGRGPIIKAELASEVNTTLPTAAVAGIFASGDRAVESADGEDWGGSLVSTFGSTDQLIAAVDTYVGWGTGDGRISYKEAGSGIWIEAGGDGVGGTGGGRHGWADGEVVAIATPNGIAHSTDGGRNFSRNPSGVTANAIFKLGNDWIAISSPGATSYVYAGESPGTLAFTGTSFPLFAPRSYDVHGGEAMVVGGLLGGGYELRRTSNGTTYTTETPPYVGGSYPACTSHAIINGEAYWLVGCDDGSIFARPAAGGEWELVHSFGVGVLDITFNGRVVIAIGGSTGASETNGYIKTTTNLSSWTTRRSETFVSAESWRSVAALEYVDNRSEGEKVPLHSIISWLHERVEADRYNVSQLTDMVEGVVFADGYTAVDAIRSAMSLYLFDAGEFDAGSGYRIHYVKRGAPAVMTLTEDDIVEGPEDWEREDSYERPRVLHVAYPNPVMDYAAPNIAIKRTSPDVKVVGERSASTPYVFSDVDEITRRCDVMMTVIYTEIAGKYEIILPWSLLSLAPTDCIGFSIRGRVRRLGLSQFRFSPDGTIKTEWRADRQSAYTSNVTGLPAIPTKPPPPSIVGPTVSAVLDIPALADNLDSLHAIVAHSGQTEAWNGSVHQRRLPVESDYTTMMAFGSVASVMGVLQDDVAAASRHYTDTTNVVRVTLYQDDELQTFTQGQFLSEHGAFALSYMDGGVRKWELLQYRDAVKVGERTWEIGTLARGRLTTTPAAHPPGSVFVLLDFGVRPMPMQSSMIGQDITHRAVSNGQLPDNAVPYTEPYTGASQREWPLAHFTVTPDGDDFHLSWVPRHRFGTDMNPIPSINFDGFQVGWQYSGQVHQEIVSGTSITYTLPGASDIDFTVTPLNRITGNGPTSTVHIP